MTSSPTISASCEVAVLLRQNSLEHEVLPQEEQQKMSADKAVVPKDQEQAKKEGGKPKVVSQDGNTIYIGFEKGYVAQSVPYFAKIVCKKLSTHSTCCTMHNAVSRFLLFCIVYVTNTQEQLPRHYGRHDFPQMLCM